jgi:hypothetical protein
LEGLVGGSTTFPDYFAFWNANETNQYNRLKKIMLTSPHLVLEASSWNDLTNTGDSGEIINPKDTSLNMAERMTILF